MIIDVKSDHICQFNQNHFPEIFGTFTCKLLLCLLNLQMDEDRGDILHSRSNQEIDKKTVLTDWLMAKCIQDRDWCSQH